MRVRETKTKASQSTPKEGTYPANEANDSDAGPHRGCRVRDRGSDARGPVRRGPASAARDDIRAPAGERGERASGAIEGPRPGDPLGALDKRARLFRPGRRVRPGERGYSDSGSWRGRLLPRSTPRRLPPGSRALRVAGRDKERDVPWAGRDARERRLAGSGDPGHLSIALLEGATM